MENGKPLEQVPTKKAMYLDPHMETKRLKEARMKTYKAMDKEHRQTHEAISTPTWLAFEANFIKQML